MRCLPLILALAALSLPMLDGCRRKPTLDPPEIRFGQDTCAECGMILSDERYAAAIVLIDLHGDRVQLLFDDVGEMLAFTPPANDAVRLWVRDATTKAWIDAADAWFVVDSELHTPMGTGTAACSTKDAAEILVRDHGGKVVRLGDARTK